MIDDLAYISKNPKYHAWSRASSVNCLVPSSKFYLLKLSDNNEAQHWRSDGHKCYNNERTNMPKGNPAPIYFSQLISSSAKVIRPLFIALISNLWQQT